MAFFYLILALVIIFPITTLSLYKSENRMGILLCVGLAVVAWYLGQLFSIAGGPIFGILTGLIITNIWKNKGTFAKGIKQSSKRILQAAIVLMGFQMNLSAVYEMGKNVVLIIISVIAVAFLAAYFIGKALKISQNEKTLIGIGTAICGGSAIAAAAPVLDADENEVVRAISTIFLFNIIAAFLFPILGRAMGMDDIMFGMWAGSAVNDTSSVVAAGYAYSESAGDAAIIVKLARTVMIIPVVLCIVLLKSKRTGISLNIIKSFPWFVFAFLLASIINTTGLLPTEITVFWGSMGRFLIIAAMVAIGFGCNIKELVKGGKRPILLGFACSFFVGLTAFLLLYI
jgi:uncharacterized integral membrane protein (TIGR00698 family)